MKRNSKFSRIIALLITAVLLFTGCSSAQATYSKDGDYLRAVHYFSNQWAVNFWGFEESYVDKDFKQIKEDGFNAIILVVPWGEFQPGIQPIKYNTNALKRLKFLMQKAKDNDLKVILRVSYLWDSDPKVQCPTSERFQKLFTDKNFYNAWLDYMKEIYKSVTSFDNFIYGFISWEDLWGVVFQTNNDMSLNERIKLSNDIGFMKYLKNKYSLSEISKKLGQNIDKYESIAIPERKSLGYKYFLDFVDNTFIEKFFKPAQKVFQKLSMEVRVDMEPIYNSGKLEQWYTHRDTYNLPGAEYTTVYYSTSMGNLNAGDTKSSKDMLKMLDLMLRGMKDYSGNNKLFIDQYVFYDNTPGFEKNTQVISNELSDFLTSSSEYLKKYTKGYALWAYRDYRCNTVYNPSFALKNEGWEITGNASFVDRGNGDMALLLKKGSTVKQVIPKSRDHYYNFYDVAKLSLFAKSVNNRGSLKISIGNSIEFEKSINNSSNIYINEFPKKNLKDYTIKLEAVNDDIMIDNLYIYSFVQKGKIYDLNGKVDTGYAAIKKLNSILGALQINNKQSENTNTAINSFDANIGLTNTNLDVRDVISGSYAIEGEKGKKYIWIRPNTKVRLNLNKGYKDISIKGYIPFSMHKKANDKLDKIIVNISGNNTLIANYESNKDETFNYIIDKTDLEKITKSSGFIDLEVHVNSVFRPDQIGGSQDNRDLSLIINSINVNY